MQFKASWSNPMICEPQTQLESKSVGEILSTVSLEFQKNTTYWGMRFVITGSQYSYCLPSDFHYIHHPPHS